LMHPQPERQHKAGFPSLAKERKLRVWPGNSSQCGRPPAESAPLRRGNPIALKACGWILVAACLLSTVAVPRAVHAEAGLSEIARARAFWAKKPYALVKSGDKDIGPDTVDLILGRDATSDEWLSYEGIMPRETLVQDIARAAITPRYLLMQLSGNRGYAAIDLESARAKPLIFRDQPELLKALAGRSGAAKLDYRTFEDWHHERVEVPARNRGLFNGSVALALVVLMPTLRRVFQWRMSVRHWLYFIAVCYSAALATPAFDGSYGMFCLIMGPPVPQWWANPLMWFGCYKLTTCKYSWSFGSGVLAALLSASFACMGMDTLQPGYWLWLTAMIALVAAADDHRGRARKPKASKAEVDV
jgi:hypothetical protein